MPVSWTDEELLEGIKSRKKVASEKRFMRKDINDPGKLHKTETVKIGFYGDDHPDWIIFNHTVLVVKTYYPAIKQCHKCGRLGHTQMGCRSNKRCIKCGKTDGDCDNNCEGKKCILCNVEGHLSSEKDKCPKWAKEIEINKIMTKKKMSKREVLMSYNNHNRFDILWDNENCPSLPSGRSTMGKNHTHIVR